MSDKDWKFSSLIRESMEQFNIHAKKVEELLNSAQKKFSNDYTGFSASIGIAMIVVAFILIWFDKSIVFSLSAIILGSFILGVAIYFRYKTADKQILYSRTLIELEKDRARFAQKQAVLHHIWLYGLPEGTKLSQLKLLMGENVGPSDEEKDTELKWKALGDGNPNDDLPFDN